MTYLALGVTLSAPSGRAIHVACTSTNGSAVTPGDYSALADCFVGFPPGVTSKAINVTVPNDVLLEPMKAFRVALSAPSHATIIRGIATATIRDNDAPTDFDANGSPDLF